MFPFQSYFLQAVVLKVHVVRHDLFKSTFQNLTLNLRSNFPYVFFFGGGGVFILMTMEFNLIDC